MNAWIRAISAVIFLTKWFVSSAQEFNLTILHVNDFHAHFEQFNQYGSRCSDKDNNAGECYGGIARLYTKVKEIYNQEENVVYLNGGDEYQGTLWFNVHRYRPYLTFMNQLNYTAMALGNHEFDTKVAGLEPLLNGINFPIVASNIDWTDEPRLQSLQKSITIERSGKRIGIVGYTYAATPETSQPDDTVIFEDEVTAVTREVEKLLADGIDIILAVGHAGFEVDKRIAAIPGVDVAVGGHTNTFLYNGDVVDSENRVQGDTVSGTYPFVVEKTDGDKALVVQDFHFAKYLGHLQVTFNSNGSVTHWSGNPIILDNSVIQDAKILEEMTDYREKVKEFSEQKLGYTKSVLREETCLKFQQCSLGNLMADAMVHWFKTKIPETKDQVVIGIINSGGIRSSISDGEFTVGDANVVFPFQNPVDVYEITGETLLAAFEYSIGDRSKLEMSGKPFLQVSSNVEVTYNISKPNGSRVKLLRIRNDDGSFVTVQSNTDIYLVSLLEFLAHGGDGFAVFKNSTQFTQNSEIDIDIFTSYIRELNCNLDVFSDCRIQFTDNQPCEEKTTTPCVDKLTTEVASAVIVHNSIMLLSLIIPCMAFMF